MFPSLKSPALPKDFSTVLLCNTEPSDISLTTKANAHPKTHIQRPEALQKSTLVL